MTDFIDHQISECGLLEVPRYRFMGDKHLFFWLLTNRMAPPAVFALPFFQLYSAIELFDTHIAVALAHCLFNIPLAVWIFEGFMSAVPKDLDEIAYLDGYPFWRFFVLCIRGWSDCWPRRWPRWRRNRAPRPWPVRRVLPAMSWDCWRRRARSLLFQARSLSTSCVITLPRVLPLAGCECP